MSRDTASDEINEREKSNLAEDAASRAEAHVYTLISSQKDLTKGMNFFVLGCQGNAKNSQAKVAAFMNSLAKDEKPDFILMLGDNFYDWGVDHPKDHIFQSNFYNIYTNAAKVPNLADIPCFVILGNHDENLHHAKLPFQEFGMKRGMHQVAHSYLGESDTHFPTTQSKIDLYAQDKLDLENLPAWNMPSRFYSLLLGDTQLFCIDSNTYVKDFLRSVGSKDGHNESLNTPSKNQATWLEEETKLARTQNRKTILALHHPQKTPGKRAYPADLKLYLTTDEIQSVQAIFEINDKEISHLSYNELLKKVFIAQKLAFHATLAADDHAIYYVNNLNAQNIDYPICQITSGGGGASLQERINFSDQEQMGCYLSQHGFTKVCSPNHSNKIFFSIYTPTNVLKFDNQSCLALRTYSEKISENEQQQIQIFCQVVHDALKEYFNVLSSKQTQTTRKFLSKSLMQSNLSYSQESVKRAHKVWAYINQVAADDFTTTIKNVYALTKLKSNITSTKTHSFLTILNKKMQAHYQNEEISLEKLYEQIAEPEKEKELM